jgi:hypothetical protein
MSASLLQLAAVGDQDNYLIGEPKINFFKSVFRKHTNFSIDSVEIDHSINNNNTEKQLSFKILKTADLLSGLYFEITLPKISVASGSYLNWTNNTAHAYLKECVFSIGSVTLDKHTGRWLDIWNELTDKEMEQFNMLNKHLCKNTYLKSGTIDDTNKDVKLYIPLQFWFCRNIGWSIPLIALEHVELNLVAKFRNINAIINTDSTDTVTITGNSTIKLYGEYIYLDKELRRIFSQKNHTYVIEQLQYQEKNTSEKNIKIQFSHPIKNLIWVFSNSTTETEKTTGVRDATLNKSGSFTNNNDYFNYNATNLTTYEIIAGNKSVEGFTNGTIKLNNSNRFSPRPASYFRLVQPYLAGYKIPTKHIYLYSFALNPIDINYSGSVNFSRLDHVTLSFDSVNASDNNSFIHIYSINYNVIMIKEGKIAIAFN